jgi:K+ transporter
MSVVEKEYKTANMKKGMPPILVTPFVLLFVVIGLGFIDCFVLKNQPGQYISGTITEIIGIIITIIFVQLLFDKKNEDDSRAEELLKIVRANKIVNLLVERYSNFLHCMIHDYKEWEKIVPSLETNFQISEMQYLHENCLLLKTGYNRSSISIFYENELELRNIFISIIQNIDFKYFPEISTLILEYVNASYQCDARGAILNNETMVMGRGKPDQKSMKEFIREALKNDAKEYMEKLLKCDVMLPNVMFPYVNLYLMINVQKSVLLQYKKRIEEIC